MPLLLSALTSSPGLPSPDGEPYPASTGLCVLEWALAVQAWATGIVPPSATVAAAAATLQTALLAAFSSASAAAAMEAAFLAFATTVGGGMAGYVPTPPPAPVGFASLFASNETTRAAGIAKVANALDAWMRTGLATLAVPPNTVVPWS